MWAKWNPSGILFVAQAPRFEFLRTQLCVKDTPYSSDYKKSLIDREALCSKELLPRINSDNESQLKLCLLSGWAMFTEKDYGVLGVKTWGKSTGTLETYSCWENRLSGNYHPIVDLQLVLNLAFGRENQAKKGLSDSNKAEGTKIKLLVLILHAHTRLALTGQSINSKRNSNSSGRWSSQIIHNNNTFVPLNLPVPIGNTSHVVITIPLSPSALGVLEGHDGQAAELYEKRFFGKRYPSRNDDGIEGTTGNTSNVVISTYGLHCGLRSMGTPVKRLLPSRWLKCQQPGARCALLKQERQGQAYQLNIGRESLGLPATINHYGGVFDKIGLLREVEVIFNPRMTKIGQTIMLGLSNVLIDES